EAARMPPRHLLEALEAIEGIADHPARLGRGIVLAHARRALPGAARGDEALVDDDHVADAALGQMKRGARAGDPAPDDDDVRSQCHGSTLTSRIVVDPSILAALRLVPRTRFPRKRLLYAHHLTHWRSAQRYRRTVRSGTLAKWRGFPVKTSSPR